MQHWYLCVECKTPDCHELMVLRHIGTHLDFPNGPEGLDVSLPAPYELVCGKCRQTHDYRLSDVEPQLLDAAPPPGFQNRV